MRAVDVSEVDSDLFGTTSLSSMSSRTWLATLCRTVSWQAASLSLPCSTARLRRSTLASLQIYHRLKSMLHAKKLRVKAGARYVST